MLENLQIGKFYLVPNVTSYWSKKVWVPVLPHMHKDPQLGNTAAQFDHFHYDLRFWGQNLLDGLYFKHFNGSDRASLIVAAEGREIKFLKRKCRRLFTGVKPSELTPQAEIWYRNQVGKSCAGKICPHFKQPMFERDGVLECPYHGLIGDIKTQIITGNIHEI